MFDDGGSLIAALNYLGVATSAMRASLTVAVRGADIVAVLLLASVAGVGGGTVRDLLIGAPVFWTRDQGYLAACLVPAALVWASGVGRRSAKALDVADAVGLGAYAVAGCLEAEMAGVPFLAAGAVGAIAATWGGLIREVLVGEPTVLVRKEVYITAALLACSVFVGLRAVGVSEMPAAVLGGGAGAGLRLLAILRAFKMPAAPWQCAKD